MRELNEQELELVAGGLGDNQINGAYVAPTTLVNASLVNQASVGATKVVQSNVDKNVIPTVTITTIYPRCLR